MIAICSLRIGSFGTLWEFSDKMHSYIQQIVLRETVDIVCRDILSPATSLVEKLTEEKVNRSFESHLEEDDEKILKDSSHLVQ